LRHGLNVLSKCFFNHKKISKGKMTMIHDVAYIELMHCQNF
jgi:hypothetical protein